MTRYRLIVPFVNIASILILLYAVDQVTMEALNPPKEGCYLKQLELLKAKFTSFFPLKRTK